MDKSSFDAEGYRQIKKQVSEAKNLIDGLYLYLTRDNQIIAKVRKYDRSGKLTGFTDHVKQFDSTLLELQGRLEKFQQLTEESLENGYLVMDNLPGVGYDLPPWDLIEVDSPEGLYTTYKSHELMINGIDFSRDYNDLDSFLESKAYKNNGRWTAISWMDDYEMLARGLYGSFTGDMRAYNKYTDDRLKAALASMLDGLPGAGTTDLSLSGAMDDQVEAKFGIKDIDPWVDEFISILKDAGEVAENREDFFKSDQYKKWLEKAGDKKDLIDRILKNVISSKGWEFLGEMGDKLDTMSKTIGLTDFLIDIFQRAVGDYTTQLAYIDTMQNSLIESGFPNGPVHEMLDELRKEYSNVFDYTMEQVGDELWGKLKKKAVKKATDLVPLLGQIDDGLSLGATAAKLFGGKQIKADESLMGLRQYDQVLTRTYQNHLELVKAGLADEEDMEQTERLLQMLVNTRKKEYEAMMTMSKGTPQYDEYKQKLNELEHLLDGGGGFR